MGPVTITLAAMAATMAQDKMADVPSPPPVPVVPAPAPPHLEAARGPNLPPAPRSRSGQVMNRADYPAAALRENRSGSTSVELAVSRWGTVGDCRVVSSSGHADLDAATCDILARRMQFWPATDAAGVAVAGTHSQTVRWALPEMVEPVAPPPIVTVSMPDPTQLFPRPPRAKNYGWSRLTEEDWPDGAIEAGRSGSAHVSFDIDAAGKVTTCRVLQTSGHPDLDARSCAIVRERATYEAARGIDGLASVGRGEQRFDWTRPQERKAAAVASTVEPSWRNRPMTLPAFMARPGGFAVKMALGDDGKATECRMESRGGMEGAKVMADRLCKDAREKGFRTFDPARNPLPREIEVVMDVKVAGKGR